MTLGAWQSRRRKSSVSADRKAHLARKSIVSECHYVLRDGNTISSDGNL
jgi:5-methylcytosine-specific restriction endonuclease McrA